MFLIFRIQHDIARINVNSTKEPCVTMRPLSIKTDNPENLVAQGTQYEEKQNKTTTQNVLDIIIRKQRQIT
jgi:hypothetical protein